MYQLWAIVHNSHVSMEFNTEIKKQNITDANIEIEHIFWVHLVAMQNIKSISNTEDTFCIVRQKHWQTFYISKEFTYSSHMKIFGI